MNEQISYKTIFLLTLPIALSMINQTIMGLIDTYFMGTLGVVQISAVGLAAGIYIMITPFSRGICDASLIFISQTIGSGNKEKCSSYVWQCFYVSTVFISALIVVYYALRYPLTAAMKLNSALTKEFITYLDIRILCLFFFAFRVGMFRFFQGIGVNNTIFYNSLFMIICKVILNWIFIFGNLGIAPMGILGAGISTILTELFCTLHIFFRFIQKKYNEQFGTIKMPVPDIQLMKAILLKGLPSGGAEFIDGLVFTFTNIVITKISVEAMAAHQIIRQLSSIISLLGLSYQIVLVHLVGKMIGAGKIEAIAAIWKKVLRFAIVSFCGFGALIFLFRIPLSSIFTKNYTVISLIEIGLAIRIVAVICDVLYLKQAMLKANGNTEHIFYILLVNAVLVFLPLILIVTHFSLGVIGAWLSYYIFLFGVGLSSLLLVNKSQFNKLEIINRNAETK